MTEQIQDTCTFDGKQWNLESWDGSYDCIPSSESLGFKTVSPSTANWAGRVDHFLIFKEQLFLFKIEATLSEDDKDVTPVGARKEVRLIYEPLTEYTENGEKEIIRIHECIYFIFDDLKIGFTGELELSYPLGDIWDYPWSSLNEEDLEPTESATLYFEKGQLIDVDIFVV